jgi:nucleotide-binding universal stress UspA family protein
MTSATLVVGADGSEHAARALEWCADHAGAFDAEVIVVYAFDVPQYSLPWYPMVPVPVATDNARQEMHDLVAERWCKPFLDAAVPHRIEIREGNATDVLIRIAKRENAALVVTGRRGRGGFAELILGSTSHALAHHLDRPLVIVP